MAVGVLARLVDIEAVVGVLDERNLDPMLREARDQLLDERGFAAARPAGEAEGFHAGCDATPAASCRRRRPVRPPAPGARRDWRIAGCHTRRPAIRRSAPRRRAPKCRTAGPLFP